MPDEIVTETPQTGGAESNLPPEPQDPAGEPPKKKRGRPVGSGKKTPESIEAGGTTTAAKPTKQKAKFSADPQMIAQMGKQLTGMHIVAAMATGIPEMQIAPEEGYALAQSIVNVCEQYNLAIDGKTGAALQLAMTCAAIYAPRLIAVKKRAANEAKQNAETAGTAVS